jgi:predicted nucleic-acid-binding protein
MIPNGNILDTNAVLRFVLNDIADQTLAVINEIETADCIIPVEIIAEMVYVLEKYYHFTHGEIALVIEYLMAYKDGLVERSNLVAFGAKVFASTKLDFIDCLLAGYQKHTGCRIITFDKDLKRQLESQ